MFTNKEKLTLLYNEFCKDNNIRIYNETYDIKIKRLLEYNGCPKNEKKLNDENLFFVLGELFKITNFSNATYRETYVKLTPTTIDDISLEISKFLTQYLNVTIYVMHRIYIFDCELTSQATLNEPVLSIYVRQYLFDLFQKKIDNLAANDDYNKYILTINNNNQNGLIVVKSLQNIHYFSRSGDQYYQSRVFGISVIIDKFLEYDIILTPYFFHNMFNETNYKQKLYTTKDLVNIIYEKINLYDNYEALTFNYSHANKVEIKQDIRDLAGELR